ncbi:WbqC family protein [Fulvivirgaceae bacterium PWU37]|uniref:WbqC family protein n=1 Tax=Dawidia soli TaxID=2782352 RepID=A0AAP2DA21_9BACT|nr:WbqC family protein [Dawidia soli]
METHYLPSVAYFAAVANTNGIILERHEYYVKQTYRNRCHVNTSQGVATLIVPVTARHNKTLITDIRIDYSQKWVNNHWRTIRSAYGNAPFFEHYADDLEKVLYSKNDFLFDLNVRFLSLCLKWLKWGIPVTESLSYETTPQPDTTDLRSLLNSKKQDNLSNFFQASPYTQVFGNAFAGNMSLIDLIFCEGPEAARRVQASIVGK